MTAETKKPDNIETELPEIEAETVDQDVAEEPQEDPDKKRLIALETQLASMKRDRTDLSLAEDMIAKTGGTKTINLDIERSQDEVDRHTIRLQELEKELASVGLFSPRRKRKLEAEIEATRSELNTSSARRAGKGTVHEMVEGWEERVRRTTEEGRTREQMDAEIAEVEGEITALKEKMGVSESESKS